VEVEMRTSLPLNKVNKDYNAIINAYVQAIINMFKDDIISIYIEGSYAKGDAREDSDFDIFIIFNRISLDKLNVVGIITSEISKKFGNAKINPQCMDIEEFNLDFFENWSMKSIIALNSVLLYGDDLSNKNLNINDFKIYYKKSLVEILMGIRHYININKPAEKIAYQNVKTFILKPLLYIMRIERFCNIGTYPLTNQDLLELYDNEYRVFLEYFIDSQKFIDNVMEDRDTTFFRMHELVERLIK
jgi:predicted nucleotidyltransferase